MKKNQGKANRNLIWGICYLLIGIASIIYNFYSVFFLVLFFGSGIAKLGAFIYLKRVPYLIIEKDYIKRSYFTENTILLSEISEIKKFAGDYIIKTSKREFTLNPNLVDKESLSAFTDYFDTIISKQI